MKLLEKFLNTRTGLIRNIITNDKHWNSAFLSCDAQLSETATFSDWNVEAATAGYGFGFPEVEGPLLGEFIERYCASLPSSSITYDCFTNLKGNGKNPVDPSCFSNFSPAQFADPTFPFLQLNVSEKVFWSDAFELQSNHPCLVPAELVWPCLSLYLGHFNKAHFPPVQAGLAAGTNTDQAVKNAVLEIIERDSMMLSWHAGSKMYSLDPTARLKGAARALGKASEVFWVLFTGQFSVPVIGCVVKDNNKGYLTMGVSCGFDPEYTARKALAEARQLLNVAASYDSPSTFIGIHSLNPNSPLAPFRVEKDYGNYYKNKHVLTDYSCHMQLYLDRKVQEVFLVQLKKRLNSTLPLKDIKCKFDSFEGLVEQTDKTIYVADVTTSDIAASNYVAIRALIPGTVPNFAMAFPQLNSPAARALIAKNSDYAEPVIPLPH